MKTLDALGRGPVFPFLPDGQSRQIPYLAGSDKVRQAISLLLETEPGERLMRPTFGCGLRRYLGKPNTAATRALIQREVELALTTWEPRIHLQGVAVLPGDDPALVFIEIRYLQARDAQEGNLVYPFYLES